MPEAQSRYGRAIAALDAANADDPRKVPCEGGTIAKELLYAERMTAWLERIDADASEELRLAVRAQHLCRWELPRTDFPDGRAGYKKWRSTLLGMHAERAGTILRDVGYDEATIERVQSLIKKRNLSTNEDAQCLEDVACLVFLAHEFAAFAEKHDDDKLVDIARKTWKKMSEHAHELALGLELPPRLQTVVERALAA